MINPYSTLLLICSLGISLETTQAQLLSLTLPEAHAQAAENYPKVRQRDLITQSTAYSIDKANGGYFPQININGQATYQSAVTEIPLRVPGMDVPTLNKDQYKLSGEVNQHLYDGGAIRLQKQAIATNADLEQQALEVEL